MENRFHEQLSWARAWAWAWFWAWAWAWAWGSAWARACARPRPSPGAGGAMTDLAPQELRVIAAVADARGFSAAARDLGMTQSAVSHSVRTSERRIGAVLFERGRRGATPTPAGDVVAAHARRILRLLDVMGTEARGIAAGPGGTDTVSGPLRIAAFRSAALHLLPPALEPPTAATPGWSRWCGWCARWGGARPGRCWTGGPIWPSRRSGPPRRWSRGWSAAYCWRRSTPWCTRPGTPRPGRCRWSTGTRTAPRTRATGGRPRAGSPRRPCRPRTTERCSRWCPVVSAWRSCPACPCTEHPTESAGPTGRHDAELVPYGPLSIDPANMTLHYAQEIFEGLEGLPPARRLGRLVPPGRQRPPLPALRRPAGHARAARRDVHRGVRRAGAAGQGYGLRRTAARSRSTCARS
ncbi:hypothetical protein SMICM17S_05448 [Streptomyces microflavus]